MRINGSLSLKAVYFSTMSAEILKRQVIEHQRAANEDECRLLSNLIHKFLRYASPGSAPSVVGVRENVLHVKSLIRVLKLVKSVPVPDVRLSFVEAVQMNTVTNEKSR